jgi:hypothetical protein
MASVRPASIVLALCAVRSAATIVSAHNKEQERLATAGVVLEAVLTVPDNIPQELLEKAECVIVLPAARCTDGR